LPKTSENLPDCPMWCSFLTSSCSSAANFFTAFYASSSLSNLNMDSLLLLCVSITWLLVNSTLHSVIGVMRSMDANQLLMTIPD
jgi:hypothetical protein